MSNYRAPLRTIQTDWRTGEVDPTFAMRVDTTALGSGARALRNMMVFATGAASRRPGTLWKATLPARCRLIEFEFDANEKYICAFANAAVYIYDAAGTLIQSITSQPWTTTTVWEINLVQKGDVMIIVHPSFKMRRLRRTALTSFVITILAFSSDTGDNVINQPYLRRAAGVDYAIGLSAWTEGTGRTLTSTTAFLNSSWVGERIRVWNKEITITACATAAPAVTTTATVTVNQTVKAELRPAPFRVELATPQLIEVTHVNHGIVGDGAGHAVILISGSTDLFGIVAANINGTRTIRILDTDHYNFDAGGGGVATAAGDGGGAGVMVQPISPTMIRDWAEQAWSDRRGWPGAITLHENRVWMGGSTGLPTFLAGSSVGDYYDFNVRDGLDDDSVQGIISAMTRIIHLVSAKQLQIFCESSESVCETQNGEPITPGSFKVINHTAYGCDPNVRPRIFDGGTIFAQRNGKNIRKLVYDFNTDQQVALPVSVVSSHMIYKPNDVAVLLGTPTRPEQYAFFVNIDGSVACYHSIESEKLNAWTPFTAGNGVFDSVCVIGTSVFFSVRRGSLYHLERFELDASDVWLDGAARISGSGTGWTIGARYADTVVTVMFNGWSLGNFAVNSLGQIILPETVTGTITVGYDYGVLVHTNAPDKELTDGPMTGESRRVVSTTIHFFQSISAAVGGEREMLGFSIGQDPSLPPVRITAKRRVRQFGYGRDRGIIITQPMPGPLTVLGATFEVSV